MEDNIIYSNILTKPCPSVNLIPWAFGPVYCSEKYGNDYYAATPGLLQGITVGTNPVSLRFDSTRSFLYVANYGSNNVSVVDISTKTVVNTIGVGTNPFHLQLDPDNNRMYVSNSNYGGSVSVIDTNSRSVIATISGLVSPRQVAVDNVGGKLYVSSYDTSGVTVVNNPDNLNYTIDRQIDLMANNNSIWPFANSWGITHYNNRLFITSPSISDAVGGRPLYVYDLESDSITNTIYLPSRWYSYFPTYTTLLRGNKIAISCRESAVILDADDLSFITINSVGVSDFRLDPSPDSQVIYAGGCYITLCPNTIP
jgi:YVTN family beta-propeller protein